MLLFEDPSIIGRDPAGQSATIATHQPALRSTATPPASVCHVRRRSGAGAATMYTSAKPGRTRNACIIFARKAKPIIVPASTIHFVAPFSSARVRQ